MTRLAPPMNSLPSSRSRLRRQRLILICIGAWGESPAPQPRIDLVA
jgi:hypothetical protein